MCALISLISAISLPQTEEAAIRSLQVTRPARLILKKLGQRFCLNNYRLKCRATNPPYSYWLKCLACAQAQKGCRFPRWRCSLRSSKPVLECGWKVFAEECLRNYPLLNSTATSFQTLGLIVECWKSLEVVWEPDIMRPTNFETSTNPSYSRASKSRTEVCRKLNKANKTQPNAMQLLLTDYNIHRKENHKVYRKSKAE